MIQQTIPQWLLYDGIIKCTQQLPVIAFHQKSLHLKQVFTCFFGIIHISLGGRNAPSHAEKDQKYVCRGYSETCVLLKIK